MQGVLTGVKFLAAAAAIAAAFPLAAGAAGKGKGPRASVSVATVCSLNKTAQPPTLDVELRVRDKSSGTSRAEVRAWSISALAKTEPGNWSAQLVLAEAGMSGLEKPVPAVIYKSFPLCSLPDGTKGLNAMATTTYGLAGEGGENRTVMNMCSDDPETLDVVEPSGIKLSASDLEHIRNMCPPSQ